MANNLPVRTSYSFGGMNIPAILLNDRDMHCVSAIFKASGKRGEFSPERFLGHPTGMSHTRELARQFGVPEDSLWHYSVPEGYWFTQLLAIEYAGWLSPAFKVQIAMLAIRAAQALTRKNDPIFREVRERGKLAHNEATQVRDKFKPKLVNNKDMKHAYANASVCREINERKNPRDIREERGIPAKKSIWEELSTQDNALRLLALAYEGPKLEKVLATTDDPNVMLRIVEQNARLVAQCRKQLES